MVFIYQSIDHLDRPVLQENAMSVGGDSEIDVQSQDDLVLGKSSRCRPVAGESCPVTFTGQSQGQDQGTGTGGSLTPSAGQHIVGTDRHRMRNHSGSKLNF